MLQNEPLARHTTLRIGGPAEYFVRVDSRAELIRALQWGQHRHLDIFILGNGSNILVSDAGIRGLVIENHADEIAQDETLKRLKVIADSGATLPGLANRLARQGWRGLEWAIGVPATVGAAVVTNAGAHDGAIRDTLVRAEVLPLAQGEASESEVNSRWWTREKLRYEYRSSFLKRHPGEYVVLRAEFQLVRDDPLNCIARMNQYSEHRRKSQPTEPSVGSMFKNPPNDYAGRLIEAAGLKGKRVGNMQVSNAHANFFVNLGGGTAAEVMELVELVRKRVCREFGIPLDLEIQLVGEFEAAKTQRVAAE